MLHHRVKLTNQNNFALICNWTTGAKSCQHLYVFRYQGLNNNFVVLINLNSETRWGGEYTIPTSTSKSVIGSQVLLMKRTLVNPQEVGL